MGLEDSRVVTDYAKRLAQLSCEAEVNIARLSEWKSLLRKKSLDISRRVAYVKTRRRVTGDA
jgi:hypothetical protein